MNAYTVDLGHEIWVLIKSVFYAFKVVFVEPIVCDFFDVVKWNALAPIVSGFFFR
jgi:hypothetical protein